MIRRAVYKPVLRRTRSRQRCRAALSTPRTVRLPMQTRTTAAASRGQGASINVRSPRRHGAQRRSSRRATRQTSTRAGCQHYPMPRSAPAMPLTAQYATRRRRMSSPSRKRARQTVPGERISGRVPYTRRQIPTRQKQRRRL